ncbi:MAG: hypothetical protein DWI57_07095 [Chloroflexi bacterium]|nr:MAG: hypothetical protein DWI57_07095 [Chloroflexota bacterium]
MSHAPDSGNRLQSSPDSPAISGRFPEAPRRTHAFWLGLLLFAVYLLSFSGRFHVMDEVAVFTVGHNLAAYGQPDINQLIWTNHWTPHPPGVWGADGQLYTKKAPGVSLLVAGLVWLARLGSGISAVFAGMLTGALSIAATASLLVIWLEDVGFSRRSALVTGLGYGLCTFALVYARMLWDLPVVGLLGLVMVWALHRSENRNRNTETAEGADSADFIRVSPPFLRHPRSIFQPNRGWLWLLLAGGSAALAVVFRYESLYLAGFGALYLLAVDFRRPLRAARPLTLFLAPLAPVALALLVYNQTRFGSLGDTGYSAEIAFHFSWFSLYGLSFSPGQGLFTTSPFLLLGLLGVRPLSRRLAPAYFWLIAGSVLVVWLFYSAWFAWGGVWNWGPRFLLTVLPLLMIFVAAALEEYADRFWLWPLAALLGLLSLAGNMAGMMTDFNAFFAAIDSNQDFVLNWQHFPPLGNWRVFQSGGPIDLAWAEGSLGSIQWHWVAALPATLLLLLAGVGLIYALRRPGRSGWLGVLVGLTLAFLLTGQAMRAYSRVEQARSDYKADVPLLSALNEQSRPGDELLITAPAYADFQELAARLMAYQSAPLPVLFWMEGGERGIHDDERAGVLSAAERSGRLWLLQRWHSSADELTPTLRWLEEERYLSWQQQIGASGLLSLYVNEPMPTTTIPARVGFVGGLTLESFAIPAGPVLAGAELSVRLGWQADGNAPPGPVTSFVHLLAESDLSQRVAESDRFLLDSQQPARSPLRPGASSSQGHLLALPAGLPPGRYVLVAGLYRSDTVERLRRKDASNDDFVYLTTIEVVAQ